MNCLWERSRNKLLFRSQRTLFQVLCTWTTQQLTSLFRLIPVAICYPAFYIVILTSVKADELSTHDAPPKSYGLNQLLVPAAKRCQLTSDTINLPAAVVACELAANHGDPDAQYLLGHLYYQGIVVDLDHEKARHWYERASLQGHSKAQYQLAFMYYRGVGLNQNYTQAYIMMKMAAVNGYSEAINVSDEINNKLTQEQRALAFYTLSRIFQLYANQLQTEETAPSPHHLQ